MKKTIYEAKTIIYNLCNKNEIRSEKELQSIFDEVLNKMKSTNNDNKNLVNKIVCTTCGHSPCLCEQSLI